MVENVWPHIGSSLRMIASTRLAAAAGTDAGQRVPFRLVRHHLHVVAVFSVNQWINPNAP